MESPRIFLACPSFDGTRSDGSANGIRFATRRYGVNSAYNISSLMDQSFNLLWCLALEERDKGTATHWAMIHSDIEPETFWLDALMDVLQQRGADLVSAVVPIKDGHGLTSTAVGHPTDPWKVERRLTMTEVMGLPETFGPEICPGRALLVNNGLWVCDLRAPWCDEVHFATENRVHREVVGGVTKRLVECVPQDWQFSRDAQARGARVVATRKVPVAHHGRTAYPNTAAWGKWRFDEQHAAGPLDVPRAEFASVSSVPMG